MIFRISGFALSAFVAAAWSAPVMAQSLLVDAGAVRACFAATPLGTVAVTCMGQAAGACQNVGQGSTTIGAVECIQAETAVWDAILNEEYRATRAQLRDEDARGFAEGLSREITLRDAQRAWIAFRDADCTAQFAQWQDGTIRSIVAANCGLTRTAQRALELRDMRGN